MREVVAAAPPTGRVSVLGWEFPVSWYQSVNVPGTEVPGLHSGRHWLWRCACVLSRPRVSGVGLGRPRPASPQLFCASADVAGAVAVCVINESAGPAREPRLGDPVRSVDVAALGAGTGGVRRIDVHHRHPGLVGLVRDELPQLCEGPAGVGGPLGLAKPYPFADARQVLQGDTASGAFRLGRCTCTATRSSGSWATCAEPAARHCVQGRRTSGCGGPAGFSVRTRRGRGAQRRYRRGMKVKTAPPSSAAVPATRASALSVP